MTAYRFMLPERRARISGDIAIIPLTKGYEAIIDASDLPLVDGVLWLASVFPKTVYAARSVLVDGKRVLRQMHRVILGAPDDLFVDHISGDGLDNRRSNLRLASRAENNCNRRISSNNTSGYKGVRWNERHKFWTAQIHVNGRQKHLGVFQSALSAHLAYIDAAHRLHGEFARAR